VVGKTWAAFRASRSQRYYTEPKTGPCLVGKTQFQSEWSGERICRRCKSAKIWRSGVLRRRPVSRC
jgi:hypothetical protein